MDLEERIKSFALLGETMRNSLNPSGHDDSDQLRLMIEKQQMRNPWFTPGNTWKAISEIAGELTEENLIRWTQKYEGLDDDSNPLKVGVIMAGNIPLSGFHDFLSVLITGNHIIAKTSSKDDELIIYLSNVLFKINPGFRNRVNFTEDHLSDFNVVIATGSDNSSRYFDFYFGKCPNIIRKNRNSIAILKGDESDEEIRLLGDDVFSYFGLGCRNVSKLYLPKGFDVSGRLKNWENFSDVIRHSKYASNYDFNKAVYLVNKEPFIDTGYLLLKEDQKISSPVSVLYYEYYDSQYAVEQVTELLKDKIQCIVGRDYTSFGKAQSPHLWDYADGIDTIDFLLKKKLAGIL